MEQCIVALSANSRVKIDRLVNLAFEAGAGLYKQDLGFMYSRSFSDPDGHMVEIFVMEVK